MDPINTANNGKRASVF